MERGGEHLLADAAAFVLGGLIETGALPCDRVALDNERAHARCVPIVVGVERAQAVGDKGLCQGFEALGGAVPGELAVELRERGAELAREGAAQQRIDAIGRNDQVALAEVVERGDGVPKCENDACGARPLLQELQQLEPADGGETLRRRWQWRCRDARW